MEFSDFIKFTLQLAEFVGIDILAIRNQIGDMLALRTSHKTTLVGAINEVDEKVFTLGGLRLESDQADSKLLLKDGSGNTLSILDVAFLNNEGTTLNLNEQTGRIELINDMGEVLSSASLESFVQNMIRSASFKNVEKHILEFKTSDGTTAFEVPYKIENIQGLRNELDNRALTNGTYPYLTVGNATKWNNYTYGGSYNLPDYDGIMIYKNGEFYRTSFSTFLNALNIENFALTNGENTHGGNWNIDYIGSPRLAGENGNGQVMYAAPGGYIFWGNPEIKEHRFQAVDENSMKIYAANIGAYGVVWNSLNFNPNVFPTKYHRIIRISTPDLNNTGMYRLYLGTDRFSGIIKIHLTSGYSYENANGYIEVSGGLGANPGYTWNNQLKCTTAIGRALDNFYINPEVKVSSSNELYIEIHKKAAAGNSLTVFCELYSFVLELPESLSPSLFLTGETVVQGTNQVDFFGRVIVPSGANTNEAVNLGQLNTKQDKLSTGANIEINGQSVISANIGVSGLRTGFGNSFIGGNLTLVAGTGISISQDSINGIFTINSNAGAQTRIGVNNGSYTSGDINLVATGGGSLSKNGNTVTFNFPEFDGFLFTYRYYVAEQNQQINIEAFNSIVSVPTSVTNFTIKPVPANGANIKVYSSGTQNTIVTLDYGSGGILRPNGNSISSFTVQTNNGFTLEYVQELDKFLLIKFADIM